MMSLSHEPVDDAPLKGRAPPPSTAPAGPRHSYARDGIPHGRVLHRPGARQIPLYNSTMHAKIQARLDNPLNATTTVVARPRAPPDDDSPRVPPTRKSSDWKEPRPANAIPLSDEAPPRDPTDPPARPSLGRRPKSPAPAAHLVPLAPHDAHGDPVTPGSVDTKGSSGSSETSTSTTASSAGSLRRTMSPRARQGPQSPPPRPRDSLDVARRAGPDSPARLQSPKAMSPRFSSDAPPAGPGLWRAPPPPNGLADPGLLAADPAGPQPLYLGTGVVPVHSLAGGAALPPTSPTRWLGAPLRQPPPARRSPMARSVFAAAQPPDPGTGPFWEPAADGRAPPEDDPLQGWWSLYQKDGASPGSRPLSPPGPGPRPRPPVDAAPLPPQPAAPAPPARSPSPQSAPKSPKPHGVWE